MENKIPLSEVVKCIKEKLQHEHGWPEEMFSSEKSPGLNNFFVTVSDYAQGAKCDERVIPLAVECLNNGWKRWGKLLYEMESYQDSRSMNFTVSRDAGNVFASALLHMDVFTSAQLSNALRSVNLTGWFGNFSDDAVELAKKKVSELTADYNPPVEFDPHNAAALAYIKALREGDKYDESLAPGKNRRPDSIETAAKAYIAALGIALPERSAAPPVQQEPRKGLLGRLGSGGRSSSAKSGDPYADSASQQRGEERPAKTYTDPQGMPETAYERGLRLLQEKQQKKLGKG